MLQLHLSDQQVYCPLRCDIFWQYFPENAWREWPKILHAAVSSPPLELVRLWSQFGDF